MNLKNRESSHGDKTVPAMGDKRDGAELEKEERDKEDGNDPTKGERDQGEEIDSELPKYKVGTFIIKEVDNIWCTGVIHRCGFDKTLSLYFLNFTKLDLEETIVMDKFVFSSDE